MSHAVFIQERAELERRLADERAISRDAERRAERAELAMVEVEDRLAGVDESLEQRDNDVQQRLMADHQRVGTTNQREVQRLSSLSSDF